LSEGKKIDMALQTINKSEAARTLNISRSSLYYKPKREVIDQEVKAHIESVLADNPSYGHKRIAIALKMNKKRILRVMKKYGIKPYRRRSKHPVKKDDIGKEKSAYTNLILSHIDEKKILRPNQIWCTDFTYIRYENRFIYMASVIDLYTREIVGINISRYHNKFLVIGAIEESLQKYYAPEIIHSDQGSEYTSEEYISFVKLIGSLISMSDKASPWQNGHKESFFGHFKLESGDLSRFETIGELIEYIYQQIYYYNNTRIHTALKMAPATFRKKYQSKSLDTPV